MHGANVFKYYNNIKKVYPDIDTWEHEAIEEELRGKEDSADVVFAVGLCDTTQKPWEDLLIFQKVALILNDRRVFFDIKQDLDIKEISYAVQCLKEQYPEELFNDEVAQYIATEALDEGFLVMPKELHFVQRYIPNLFINPEQEKMQKLYLNEVHNYTALMEANPDAEVNS